MIRRRKPIARTSVKRKNANVLHKSRKAVRKQRKSKSASLKRKCDKLWSLVIRRTGACKLAGKDHVRCGGVLQAAHCFGRGHAGVRHELWNGWAICSGHHVWYTHHPEAWTALLIEAWGQEVYQTRYEQAKAIAKPDYSKILSELGEVA